MTKVYKLTTTHRNLEKKLFDRVATYANGAILYFETPDSAKKYAATRASLVDMKIEECELPPLCTIHK